VAESPASGPVHLDLLEGESWQMVVGERAALVGVLSRLRPRLAIEVGTADGGSLSCLARHCEEVHSFDLHHGEQLPRLGNVELHTGDSHVLLPQALETFRRDGRAVEFALVDGDHTTEGVRRDMEDLLSSGAVRRTVILAHDACNPEVRAGLERVDYAAYGKVSLVDLDFVSGHLSRTGPFANQLWGGLALIVVDEEGATGLPRIGRPDMHPTFEVMSRGALGPADSAPGGRAIVSLLRRWLRPILRRSGC
jgi:Methyltransferase domain